MIKQSLIATALVISAFGAFAQDAAKPVMPAANATTAAPAASATATKKVAHAKVKAKKAAAPSAM